MSRRLVSAGWRAWCSSAVALADVSAHPAADTEVVVTLDRSGTLEITLATARDPLVLKLEALAGKTPDPALSEAAREGRILTLQSTLLDQLELNVDGKPLPLTLTAITGAADRPGSSHDPVGRPAAIRRLRAPVARAVCLRFVRLRRSA